MAKKQRHQLQDGDVVKTSYTSRDVPIPPDFLVADDPLNGAADPIVVSKVIDWRATPIPEYADRYAVVIDNVLSPSECATLVRLAEESVILDSDSDSDSDSDPEDADYDDDGDYNPEGKRKGGNQNQNQKNKKKEKMESEKQKQSPWQPALVNIGHGMEAFDKLYRNSDRIIWDNQTVMDRLWARCARAEGLREALAVVDDELPQGSRRVGRQGVRKGMRWEFARFNHRGRYLRYTSGQYFRREFVSLLYLFTLPSYVTFPLLSCVFLMDTLSTYRSYRG